jgi:hypothetical protein
LSITALVLIRLHRYRRNFTSLLAHSNTNRSRFVRLFAICIVWLAISIPLEIYVISRQTSVKHHAFNWASVHDPANWNTIEMIPSGGRVVFTRYVWLGNAIMVFLFFGFGRDASRNYAKGLRAMGLGKCLPFLDDQRTPGRTTSHTGTVNSVSSKARLLFSRKGSSPLQSVNSVKSWATDSRSSKTTDYSIAEPLSPKTMKHLETVNENSRMQMQTPVGSASKSTEGTAKSRYAFWLGERRFHTAADVEKSLPVAPKDVHPRFGFQHSTSPYRAASASEREVVLPMSVMRNHGVKSTIAAGPLSPESRVVIGQGGILVRKDVRQGSETDVDYL